MSHKGMRVGQQMKNMRKQVCIAVKDILNKKVFGKRGEQNGKTAFIVQCLDFLKKTEIKDLCSDNISVVWSRLNTDMLLSKPAALSKALKRENIGKFHLQ